MATSQDQPQVVDFLSPEVFTDSYVTQAEAALVAV